LPMPGSPTRVVTLGSPRSARSSIPVSTDRSRRGRRTHDQRRRAASACWCVSGRDAPPYAARSTRTSMSGLTAATRSSRVGPMAHLRGRRHAIAEPSWAPPRPIGLPRRRGGQLGVGSTPSRRDS
jgi:hypothetical protein